MGESLPLQLHVLEATHLGKHGHGRPNDLQSREKVLLACSLTLNRIGLTSSGVPQFQAHCGYSWEGKLLFPLQRLHRKLH